MTPILDLAASHVDDLELRRLFSELCSLGSVSSADRYAVRCRDESNTARTAPGGRWKVQRPLSHVRPPV